MDPDPDPKRVCQSDNHDDAADEPAISVGDSDYEDADASDKVNDQFAAWITAQKERGRHPLALLAQLGVQIDR